MSHPKFTLRALLVCIAIVALFFGAWRVTIRQRPVTVEETMQVKVGMSKSQVNWILGRPPWVFKNPALEYWGFDYADKQAPPNTRFYVQFERGSVVKVEQSSKIGGPLTTEDLLAPVR